MGFKDKVLKIIAEDEFVTKFRNDILIKLEKDILKNYLKAVEENNKAFVEKMIEFEKNIDKIIENKVKKIMQQPIVPNSGEK